MWFDKKKKKKGEKGNYQHETPRDDWENMLNELFDKVVGPWKNGLSVVSNTRQSGLEDPSGTISLNLCFRLKQGMDANLKQAIQQFNRSQFEQIFALANKKKPDLADCYAVKKLGLPDNTLVYLVTHHISRAGDRKRALLAFAGPCYKQDLQEHVAKASGIITGPEQIRISRPEIPAPPPIPTTKIGRTHREVIQARLDYLESVDFLKPSEQKEQKELESYLMHLFSKSFD